MNYEVFDEALLALCREHGVQLVECVTEHPDWGRRSRNRIRDDEPPAQLDPDQAQQAAAMRIVVTKKMLAAGVHALACEFGGPTEHPVVDFERAAVRILLAMAETGRRNVQA